MYACALQIKEQHLGRNHPDVGMTLNNMGMLFQAQGEPVRAREFFERTLAVFNESLGATHPYTAVCNTNCERLLGFVDK